MNDIVIIPDSFNFSKPSPVNEKRSVSKRRALSQLPRIQQSRFMDAAKTENLYAGWTTFNHSADAIIRTQVSKVRARSRYLEVNDPYFKRFLRLVEENVIGASGIRMQMNVVESVSNDGSVVQDERANRTIEMAWKQWSKRRYCTANQMDSFLSIQKICMRGVARDGEVFIRKHRGSLHKHGFALEMIEPDHVPHELNKTLKGGRYIQMGIEYNAKNRVIAYHILESHPGDNINGSGNFSTKTMRIPAEQIVHLFVKERPSQTRGIPWAVNSMTRSKMLDGYEQAELVAARAAASKMGFFTQDGEEEYVADDEGVDSNGREVGITEFEAGIFEQLPHGVDFKAFDPQHPAGNFEPFTKRILRGISSGLGIGYNTMANDYEGVNFSSLRQSNLSERDYWRCLQNWLSESLHDEIYMDWLEMAITSGVVNLSIAKLDKFDAVEWRARGWSWVDPVKEMVANEKAIALNLDSASNIAAQQGLDYEKILQDKAEEKRLREKYDIGDITQDGGTDMLDAALKEQLQEEEKNGKADND